MKVEDIINLLEKEGSEVKFNTETNTFHVDQIFTNTEYKIQNLGYNVIIEHHKYYTEEDSTETSS